MLLTTLPNMGEAAQVTSAYYSSVHGQEEQMLFFGGVWAEKRWTQEQSRQPKWEDTLFLKTDSKKEKWRKWLLGAFPFLRCKLQVQNPERKDSYKQDRSMNWLGSMAPHIWLNTLSHPCFQEAIPYERGHVNAAPSVSWPHVHSNSVITRVRMLWQCWANLTLLTPQRSYIQLAIWNRIIISCLIY